MSRRLITTAALTAAAGIAVTAVITTQSAGASTISSHNKTPKPTVVLVHGAWADGSSWNGEIKRLQNDGYRVVAPPVPLRGLSGDSAYLRDYLKTVTGPIVLVGHSYGGSVITQAALGNTQVKALVYVAAYAPAKGETVSALTSKFPGSHISDDPTAPIPTALNAVPFSNNGTGDVDLYIKPDKFNDVFLSNRVNSRTAAALAAAQRPVAPQALGEPAGDPAWKTIPSWFLIARDDHLVPAAAGRFMAGRAHGHTTEVKAPHNVLLTDPDAVTRVIKDAARNTSN